MQESVAGGRQCVAVSLELVGSLVESYQHGLSDVSSILPLQQLCWGSYRGERICQHCYEHCRYAKALSIIRA